MPTVITHSIVGLIAGKIMPVKNLPRRFWVLSLILPVLPDADIISFYIGLPYENFWAHRGFFHSIPFAFILALTVMFLFFRREKYFSRRWNSLLIYFFVLTASHGLFDALTNGGLGIALFSPFENSRYFFPFRPIEVSPIGVKAFFSLWGIRVILSEMLWFWLPGIILLLSMRVFRRRY
ncbi:MAG: metal-dependent hydrolase [FCB group bacterium]|nr:metal-dependent hydrolase [FCB group bacterium]